MPPAVKLTLRGAFILAAVLVLVRSAVWIVWPQAHFDSDGAILGLMAEDLIHGRAFPLFFYGQNYMLGVEAWLAAPLFAVAGPSVVALKLPLLVMNLTAAVFLVRILVRDAGLTPIAALMASLFFVFPPPIAASKLMEAMGGDIEPFLYVLLLWMWRDRPVLFGVTAGIGLMNREFTLYAVTSILLLEVWRYRLATRRTLRSRALSLAIMTAIIVGIGALAPHAALLGPDSAGPASRRLWDNDLPVSRVCWNPAELALNVQWFVRENLGTLFGYHPDDFARYTQSRTMGGHLFMGWSLLALLGVLAGGARLRRRPIAAGGSGPDVTPGSNFPLYLAAIGIQSALVYVLLACDPRQIALTRYTLLVLLLPIGALAWFFRTATSLAWRRAAVVLLLVWAAGSAWDHGKVLAEFLTHPPPNEYRDLTNGLRAFGVRYAKGDYWSAYMVDFLSHGDIIVASTQVVRIERFQTEVERHAAEAALITEKGDSKNGRCEPGTISIRRWCVALPK
jgi:hypothetical protein